MICFPIGNFRDAYARRLSKSSARIERFDLNFKRTRLTTPRPLPLTHGFSKKSFAQSPDLIKIRKVIPLESSEPSALNFERRHICAEKKGSPSSLEIRPRFRCTEATRVHAAGRE